MKKIFLPLIVIPSLLVFSSCEKKVEFRLDDTAPKLVVEGTIENGKPPVISLSKSMNYFSSVDVEQISNNFVHNAEVYVSNGAIAHKLKEYRVHVGSGYYFYYYSNDPLGDPPPFTGQLNKTYSLRIVTEGKEYTATTTIPNITRRIDSIFWRPSPPGNPPEKVMVMVRAYDPPGFGDYIRYYTQRNSEPMYPGLTSVYDDQVIDGSSYEVQVERGVDRNADHPEGYSFFDRGDTVTLKVSNIDKATFDFWRTMEFTYASVGNPFSSPTKVIGNISGGALGYFGGYASQFKTLIIPR